MPTSYALLSTYPPTQCGLATFTAALLDHLPQPGDRVVVVRVLDQPAPRPAAEVVQNLVAGSVASAAAAADALNSFDVVIVQHEYGIYGGADGQEVVALLEALYVPSIVVLHTVLAHPTPRQRAILDRVIDAASAVVTMTQTARTRLLDIYGTSPERVFVIPHRTADNRWQPIDRHSQAAAASPIILTWGLLGPGKGIEHAIDAMAILTDRGLSADYQVVERDPHPRVLDREGEAYRRVAPAKRARTSAASADTRALRWPGFLKLTQLARLIHAGRRRAAALRLAGAGHLGRADRGAVDSRASRWCPPAFTRARRTARRLAPGSWSTARDRTPAFHALQRRARSNPALRRG